MYRVRAFLATVFIALATIIGSLTALVLRVIDRSGDLVVDLARLWSRAVLAVAGVKVQVEWKEPLQPGQAYVFMANHESSVDIWSLLVAIPLRFRMIAKKQLLRIPLFGWAMWAGRFIFIDRVNAVAARRSIDEAKRRIRGGDSVLIFPEGTRSRDGSLGPFKKGGFHLAIDSGVPVVPVALHGTGRAMPRGSLFIRPGVVRATVGAPIPTAGLTEEDRHKLLEVVRSRIANMLAAPGAAAAPPDPGAVGASGAQ